MMRVLLAIAAVLLLLAMANGASSPGGCDTGYPGHEAACNVLSESACSSGATITFVTPTGPITITLPCIRICRSPPPSSHVCRCGEPGPPDCTEYDSCSSPCWGLNPPCPLPYCTDPANPPPCDGIGAPCGNCCLGLDCINNVCAPPPVCGNSGDLCDPLAACPDPTNPDCCCAGLSCDYDPVSGYDLCTSPPPPPNNAPTAPAAPTLSPDPAYPTTILTASDVSGTSTDTDGPPPITYAYKFFRNGALAQEGASRMFDCPSAGCAAGDAIFARATACDSYSPPACSESANSNSITIQSVPPPPPSLGGWQAYAVMALLIGFALIALLFMSSQFLGMPHLRAIASDELLQLVATGVVLLCFVGLTAALDGVYLPAFAGVAGGGGGTLQDEGIATVASLQTRVAGNLDSLGGINRDIGKVASQSVYCSFMGSGYTLVACNSLNSVRGALANSMSVLAAAQLDLTGLQMLLTLARNYAFLFILPIGLFLRTFKFTRAAGGALIALALGLYVVLPLMVLFSENHLMGTIRNSPEYSYLLENPNYGAVSGSLSCDPYDSSSSQIQGFARTVNNPALYSPVLFLGIVRIIFMTIVMMLVTLTFVRWFAGIVGSEIDVSTLARIS